MYKLSLLLLCYITCCLLFSHTLGQEQQQSTTLRGDILKSSEKCRTKVSQNSRIKMHFTARVWDVEEPFEDTYSSKPLSLKLGRDKMMEGLEAGIQGMCEEEIRRITIPAEMAFGKTGLSDKVLPNSAIIYDVEMLKVDTPLTNQWFWSGLAVIAATYIVVSRMASQVDKSKAERYLKKLQQTSTSASTKTE
ncbi:hypothetical protein BDC45DRAFT_7433 [Circinella umbellata]|nr:hypothetical protein BDC45DRAFT_7433 [Circinella umbellata]